MSANETFLTGSETKLYTFNQARAEANRRMGTALSLKCFGELLTLSSVRPAFCSASEETSGMYDDAQISRFCEEYQDPTSPVKQKAKGRPVQNVTMTKEQWEEYEALRAARDAALATED